MRALAFTGNALCQACKLEGLSDRAEANIESSLRGLWENNGPDYVIKRLKVLKADTERSLVDSNYRYTHHDGEQSVSWNHKQARPKGPLGVIYVKFPRPEDRIRVIGAIISSIVYEHATEQQITKALEGIRGDTRSSFTVNLGPKTLYRLESALERRVRESKPFAYTDLTNDALPYAHVCHQIGRLKERLHEAAEHPELRNTPETHQAILEIHADYIGQFYTAPSICKQGWNKALELAYHGQPIPEGVKYPRRIMPRPFVARDYESRYRGEYLCLESGEYSPRGKADYIGRLDFLQKPGGKLRSICNTNRYVNYVMQPYAKALEDIFYILEPVKVKDQPQGLRKAQLKLREGKRITSLDLSAATDTLDFRTFTRALKKDFPGKTGLLEHYAELFENLSELPLWCDTLNCAIQFKTGQPLGMKGSFQTLTAMNLIAGRLAEGMTYGKDAPLDDHFCVVGDDFWCESEMANAYNAIIRKMGGKTNAEKAMESDQYAEFLSHIVSKDRVYVTKPKYRLGSKALYSNLEKAKVRSVKHLYRLTDTEKDAVRILSEYSVDELDFRNCLPNFRSKHLENDDYLLTVMDAALQLVSEWRSSSSLDFEISENALDYIVEEDLLSQNILKQYSEAPLVNGTLPKGPVLHDGIATLPTKTLAYDHHTDEYKVKTSRKEAKQLVENRSDDMKKIDDVLRTDANSIMDLGHGRSISTEDIVLAAMQVVDELLSDGIPNRKQAATQISDPILQYKKYRERLKAGKKATDLDTVNDLVVHGVAQCASTGLPANGQKHQVKTKKSVHPCSER